MRTEPHSAPARGLAMPLGTLGTQGEESAFLERPPAKAGSPGSSLPSKPSARAHGQLSHSRKWELGACGQDGNPSLKGPEVWKVWDSAKSTAGPHGSKVRKSHLPPHHHSQETNCQVERKSSYLLDPLGVGVGRGIRTLLYHPWSCLWSRDCSQGYAL